MLMEQRNLDYNKHCQVQFGACVQVNQANEPTNTNAPRTLDAIHSRPMMNCQGDHELPRGHKVMNFQTGKVIARQCVCPKPVTDLVIKAVEAMAAHQGT